MHRRTRRAVREPGNDRRPPHRRPPVSSDEPIELDAERIPPGAGHGAPPPPRGPRGAALAVAIAADAIQLILMPLFFAGAASPWNDALDLLVAGMMVRLLGWHWAFLPTFLVELIPAVDLVPTWTMAVWIVTRRRPV